MLSICYEELDVLKEDIEKKCFRGKTYLDTWDYEDEYSHDDIQENRNLFILLSNDYFRNHNLPFLMKEVCDNAMVCDLNGKVLIRKELI